MHKPSARNGTKLRINAAMNLGIRPGMYIYIYMYVHIYIYTYM